MFFIDGYCDDNPDTNDELILKGLDALDFRRLHGLGDDSFVHVSTDRNEYVEVPESVARAFFPRDKAHVSLSIPSRLLVPGEIVPHPKDSTRYFAVGELTAARFVELLHAGCKIV
jgi:RIO-like serine/threonine protein kinase